MQDMKMEGSQVESGVKLTSPIKIPTFVFSSLWPSWLFAAKAAGYTNIVTCVEDVKPGVREVMEVITGDDSQLVDWMRWKEAMQNCVHQNDVAHVLILLQGPQDALNRVVEFLMQLGSNVVKLEILAFPTSEANKKRPAKKRQKLMSNLGITPIASLSHHMVGGVVSGVWTLESNMRQLEYQRNDLERQCNVIARLLCQIICRTHKMVFQLPRRWRGSYKRSKRWCGRKEYGRSRLQASMLKLGGYVACLHWMNLWMHMT